MFKIFRFHISLVYHTIDHLPNQFHVIEKHMISNSACLIYRHVTEVACPWVWQGGPISIQIRPLIIRSREVPEPQDWSFQWMSGFEIWQVPMWQWCQMPVKCYKNGTVLNTKLSAATLQEILHKDILLDMEMAPWYLKINVIISEVTNLVKQSCLDMETPRCPPCVPGWVAASTCVQICMN